MSIAFRKSYGLDVVVRLGLWTAFLIIDQMDPFIRIIQPEEMWLYKYPRTPSYVSTFNLWVLVFTVPTFVIIYDYLVSKDKVETSQALLSLSLNYGLNGFITVLLKMMVGRPRPDFLNRCASYRFKDGKLECNGDIRTIMDGRKSFPSGHTSFAFASMVFVSLFLAGRMHVFNSNGRGDVLKLLFVVTPLVVASAIGISRTCDYHHHWQDVFAGASIGTIIAYICYRQYFPSVNSRNSDLPYTSQPY